MEQLDKTKKGVLFLKDMSKKLGGKLPVEKRELLNKLTRTQFKLMGDLKGLQDRKKKVEEAEAKMSEKKRGKVSCSGTIYPGVRITITKARRNVTEEMKFAQMVERNGEVEVLPYGN
jgi:uncharacterized protein (DUF342 family)